MFHLSRYEKLTCLTPHIPENAISENEDTTIARVCFAETIEGCLSSLQHPGIYFVYVPAEYIFENDKHYPSIYEVKDAEINKEIWVTRPVSVKCIGIINAQNYDWTKEHETDRGKVVQFHYPYHWIMK